MHPLSPQVEALLETVAAQVIMPRYRQLDAQDIEEKSPGELVTIADKESEARLNHGLAAILPEARMVGEEACAQDPSLMQGLESGTAWIIDPIDGTANFAEGKAPFAIMIALVAAGEAISGWIYDPIKHRHCHAHRGGGAWINGVRVLISPRPDRQPVAAISTKFMAQAQRDLVLDRAKGHYNLVDVPRCAGEQYPRIVLGENDLTIFERMLPWDHIPGALFLAEAGGHIARLDGSPYHFWDGKSGALGAASRALWEEARDRLF